MRAQQQVTRSAVDGGKHTTGRHRLTERARMASPARRLELIGLVIGLTAGFCLAFGWPVSFRHGASHPPHTQARVPVTTDPVVARSSGGLDPAALNAQWTAYSDRSGCADWAGGDGVSAVRLSSSQIAWFFSDTYLGPAGPDIGFSRSSGFLHNSVVIQTVTGHDSKFVTLTGGGACRVPGRPTGPPAAVVAAPRAPGGTSDKYWDEDGVQVGGTVVKFYNRYLPGAVPFVPAGTVIATYPVSQLSAAGHGTSYNAVARPGLISLPSYTPPSGGSPIVWGAALLRAGNTFYVYGTQSPDPNVPNRQLYLARVHASRLTQFAAWQFYAGAGLWQAGEQNAQPVLPSGTAASGSPGIGVSSGFSVVKAGQRYWLIQAGVEPGGQDIDAFPAATPWGPFDPSAGIVLYHNADIGLNAAHDYRIMYEARAEPALSTSSTLVISYNVNSEGVTAGCVPMSALTNTVTQPRFIAVPLAVLSADSVTGPGDEVTVGRSDYPHIASRDPGQWFNGWAYPGACPPVPGLAGVHAKPQPGAVTLTWPDAGLGLRYQVYLFKPGAADYALVTTSRSDSTTITGLPAGVYLAKVVPANFHQTTGQPAEVSFSIPLGTRSSGTSRGHQGYEEASMWLSPGSKKEMSNSDRLLSSGCPIRARHSALASACLPAVHPARSVLTRCHAPVGVAACHTLKSPPRLVCSITTSPCPAAEKSPAETASGLALRKSGAVLTGLYDQFLPVQYW
jgi:hypothetical protein